MQRHDLFSLEPLPQAEVPSRKRRLALIALVWLVGLGFVTAAQIELDAIDPAGANAALTDKGFAHTPTLAQAGLSSRSDSRIDR
jgi:hypothetical protein